MARLTSYSLSHNKTTSKWELKAQGADRPAATFATKAAATKGGVLEKAVGKAGGSVRIRTVDGKIQEERTYPGSADPRRSKG